MSLCLCIGLTVYAGKPKIGPGYTPGLGDGTGASESCGTGTNTEVILPMGLPETGIDPSQCTSDPSTSNIVYTFNISGDNGAASANQAHSAFEKAREVNAACVLIRINGFAGGWDVAENIRQEMLDYDKPVMVYVNNQSIPADEFISSGADDVYTKKGTTISSKKSASKGKKSSVAGTASNRGSNLSDSEVTIATDSKSSEDFSNDVTMNEILYKAGLGNLTVVQHNPGFSERALDFLMNPLVMLVVLLLTGFALRKTAKSKLPGPMIYLLAVILMLYLAPFQLTGLANNWEVLISILLVAAIIISFRYEKRWLTGTLLLALSLVFALVRAGDTATLFEYTSASELVTLPAVPLGLVIVGWWIGKLNAPRRMRVKYSRERSAEMPVATA